MFGSSYLTKTDHMGALCVLTSPHHAAGQDVPYLYIFNHLGEFCIPLEMTTSPTQREMHLSYQPLAVSSS